MTAWALTIALLGAALGWRGAALRGRARPARALLGLTLASAIAFGLAARDELGLQKLAAAFAMPLGLLWLLLLELTLRALASRARPLAVGLVVATLALSLLGNAWLAGALARQLEDEVPVAPLPEAPFDAILVPGGGAGFDRLGEAQLSDHGDRVALAARLYQAGRTRYLITTGSAIGAISDGQDLSEATRRVWVELGVPDDAILRLPEPKNTSQEIRAAKALVTARGFASVGLVGSALHLPRTLALCAREGLAVTPIAADRRARAPVWHPLGIVPSAKALALTTAVAWERVGRLVGR